MIAADEPIAAAVSAPTPARVFLPGAARERFAAVAALCAEVRGPGLVAVAAYSVKTNPRRELLALAREHGFFAEVITPQELAWARELGFEGARTIANGPYPLGPGAARDPLAFAFADSIEAFERNVAAGLARVHGVRLRPSMLGSRFGVPIEDDAALARTVAAAPLDAIAVSFHARRGDFHDASWLDVARDVLGRAVALRRASGREIVAFDVGGGWTPEQLDAAFVDEVGAFAAEVEAALPACARLVVEPGQAIATPCEALVTTVLEVRERAGRREAIVDAGYPEWPLMHAYVHPLHVVRGEALVAIGTGPDRLGGRTCLEYDVLDGLRFPPDLAAGDRIVVGGTGSYDASMRFRFAEGGTASGDSSS